MSHLATKKQITPKLRGGEGHILIEAKKVKSIRFITEVYINFSLQVPVTGCDGKVACVNEGNRRFTPRRMVPGKLH